ncbi:MAG: hypothetical protein KIT84_10270 [Labilithrix sp.]|nr:hypothetical protein [Labilithrix sp.]MCW5811389.1 hypothetical protein [Labilithrix sp.]
MELKDLNPFTQMGKMMETWTKMAEDSASRASAFWAEMEKADSQRVERASAAIDEVARLQKESLAYGARVGAEMRKLSVDAMKQVTSLVTKSAPAASA